MHSTKVKKNALINPHIHESVHIHHKIHTCHGMKSWHASRKNYFLIILLCMSNNAQYIVHCWTYIVRFYKSARYIRQHHLVIKWGRLTLIWIFETLTLVTHCNSVFMVFKLQASWLSHNAIWWQFLPLTQCCLQWMDSKVKPRLQWITSVIFPGKITAVSPVTINTTWLVKYTNYEWQARYVSQSHKTLLMFWPPYKNMV
jgi:hypothetical protein